MFTNNLLLLVLSTSAFKDSYETSVKTYSARDVQPVGCNETTTQWTTTSTSTLSCAISCATDKTCAASHYSLEGICYLCRRDLVRALGFIPGLAVFWPQQYRERWPLTKVDTKYTVWTLTGTVAITIGSVVHLHGMFNDWSGFFIEFRQDVAGNNVSFQFRSRLGYSSRLPVIVMTSCNNSIWGNEVDLYPLVYPFVVNTTTTLDILVREDSYQVYIDQKFCCYYNHVISYENIKYIKVIGFIEVYELLV